MNFKKRTAVFLFAAVAAGTLTPGLSAYQMFIFRPTALDMPSARPGGIAVHGEFFGWRLEPSTFPSYNDHSGPVDRWNFGFQNRVRLTPTTVVFAQLLTHDDGERRTKFDWHFHLRQQIIDNVVLIIGHDSDHDSDNLSRLNGKSFFTNRNYVGVGFPVEGETYYFEPFTWFFHHTNQRAHLDLSGEILKQEFGLRFGAVIRSALSVHIQIFTQTDTLFNIGQAWIGDAIVRFALAPWLELSAGFGFWKDILESPAGTRQSFHKLHWGIAVPF